MSERDIDGNKLTMRFVQRSHRDKKVITTVHELYYDGKPLGVFEQKSSDGKRGYLITEFLLFHDDETINMLTASKEDIRAWLDPKILAVIGDAPLPPAPGDSDG